MKTEHITSFCMFMYIKYSHYNHYNQNIQIWKLKLFKQLEIFKPYNGIVLIDLYNLIVTLCVLILKFNRIEVEQFYEILQLHSKNLLTKKGRHVFITNNMYEIKTI